MVGVSDPAAARRLADVSNVLWRERQLLDLLLFKLSEEQLLVGAGLSQWLPLATREIEAALDAVKDAELSRAVVVDAAAVALGLPDGPSLRALAEAAPAPWCEVLVAHHRALRATTQRIATVAHDHRGQLARGAHAVRARFPAQPVTAGA